MISETEDIQYPEENERIEIKDEGEKAQQSIKQDSPPKIKDWQPTIANAISFIALVISGILAVYTYKVFQIANSQSESVIKSANAAVESARTAKNTLEETKRYNREYLTLQKELFKSSNEDSRNRSKRDSSSLDIQLQNIKETKNEFEIENRPYLEILNIKDKVKFGEPIEITFDIYNLGRQPAKIQTFYTYLYYNKFGTFKLIPIFFSPIESFEGYVTSQASFKVTLKSSHILPNNIIDGIKNKNDYVYVNFGCKYINPVTSKVNKFIYNFRLTYEQSIIRIDHL